MLELGNLEYMFSPWRLEWARKFMKKEEFLRSAQRHLVGSYFSTTRRLVENFY